MSIVERVSTFLQSALAESRKVTWPGRDELQSSTAVVLVSTFIVMIYLFVVDRTFASIIGLFVRGR